MNSLQHPYYANQFNSSSIVSSPMIDTSLPSSPMSTEFMKNDQQEVYQSNLFENQSETDFNSVFSHNGLHIRVHDIAEDGAKSRVETQIKLTVELTTKDDVKVPHWSYLRIHESMLSKSKLRKSQQQKLLDGSAAAMVSDESMVLDLEARVVCETDEQRRIKMCLGCVRRERKRAERKKDLQRSIRQMNTVVRDEAFERDRQRILLFNCEPLVNFSTGEAILPTRITCYCRHHNERIGFRVRFVMRNNRGIIVGTGETPPIMITDDHKTTKQPGIPSIPRRRRRARVPFFTSDELNALATPSSSRRNSASSSEADGAITPITSNSTSLPPSYFTTSSSTFTHSILGHSMLSPLPTPKEVLTDNEISSLKTPTAAENIWRSALTSSNPYGISDMSSLHHMVSSLSQPIVFQNTAFDEHAALPITHRQRRHQNLPQHFPRSDTCSPSVLTINSMEQGLVCNPLFHAMNPAYVSSTLSRNHLHQLHSMVPILHAITPSNGPTYGGIEVTISGENFNRDMTFMFGNRAATNVCWSPTSIICLLPPAEHNGPAAVALKENPLMTASQLPPIFEYYKQGRQGILDLALHAVGLQTSAPNNTVISIVNNNCLFSNQATESEVINLISQHCVDSTALGQTNSGKQNLLHMAAYLNYANLVHFLMIRNSNLVHSQDSNGLTPIHFACQNKSTNSIRGLLKGGASVAQMSSVGTPIDLVATLLNPMEFQELERQIHSDMVAQHQQENTAVAWLPSLFVYAATQFYHRSNSIQTNGSCTNFYISQNSPPPMMMIQEMNPNSLFYQM